MVAIYEGKAWLHVGDLEVEIHAVVRSGPEMGGGWFGVFSTTDKEGAASVFVAQAQGALVWLCLEGDTDQARVAVTALEGAEGNLEGIGSPPAGLALVG